RAGTSSAWGFMVSLLGLERAVGGSISFVRITRKAGGAQGVREWRFCFCSRRLRSGGRLFFFFLPFPVGQGNFSLLNSLPVLPLTPPCGAACLWGGLDNGME